MNARDQQVSDLYQWDLERHLFAPAQRRNRRQAHRMSLEPMSEWLRDWMLTGWSRWKALAQAAYLG